MTIVRFHDGERREMRKVFDGKSEAEALLLALSGLDEPEKPCKDTNTNVCVAEGCYGEACSKRSTK